MASLPLSDRNEDELQEERNKKGRLLTCLVYMVIGMEVTFMPDHD